MVERRRPYAVLGEFAEPGPLLEGARSLRERGWRVEIFSPFPLEGMGEALGWGESRIPLAFLLGGTLGALAGFLMQVYTNLDFPIDVGGRPLIAVPGFMMITFELLVLFAVGGGIGTMLVANRLPRLHHPLFDADRFGLASDDRFFLAVFLNADSPNSQDARAALWRLHAREVTELGESKVS